MSDKITFNEYSARAAKTDRYPSECKPWVYALGLAGESGETLDKIKKIYRDKSGVFKVEDRREIAKELGDVLWYVTRLGATLGFNISEIAQINIDKLEDRAKRDAIKGSGDNR